MLLRDGGDRDVVGRLAEEVDGDDGARLELALLLHRDDGGLEAGGVHVVGVGQDIDEDRAGADERHDFGAGDEGEAGHEHRVARPDVPGAQRDQQGVGAVGAGERVLRAGERCERLLEAQRPRGP